jgi:glyoxylase-like metal-dependent hydrolase (beta-lactamase superfamily II)
MNTTPRHLSAATQESIMLTLSRRQFLGSSAAALGLAAGGLVLPRRAYGSWLRPRADTEFYKWSELAPGFLVAFNQTGDFNLVGGNSTLIVKKGAGVCIDTKQTVLGPSLLREAQAHTDAVVAALNTHHHFDHTGGNATFSHGGAKLFAHPKCRERVAAQTAMYTAGLDQRIKALDNCEVPGAKQAAQDARALITHLSDLKADDFTPQGALTDGAKLDAAQSAGHKIEVHHVGPGHTDNDVFFFFPEENVLVAGDLIFNKLHAYFDQGGGASVSGWIKSLQRVVTLCNQKTVVIPGHGEADGIDAAKRQIKYFEDVQAAVAKAIKDGKKREEVVEMTLPQYADYGLKQALPLVLGGAYDELTKVGK